MNIGLNLLYMIPDVVGGTEMYARGLVQALKELDPDYEFVLFINRESAGLGLGDGARFKTVVCPVNAIRRSDRFLYEHLRLRRDVRKEKIDLLHSLGYTSPLFLSCPTVVTVHDLNFRAFGNLMSFSRRFMLSLAVKQAVLRTNKVITMSEFSRQEILKEYRVPPEKVVVTHVAVDEKPAEPGVFSPSKVSVEVPGVRGPYIVAFSSTYPNKNIPRLIEAFGAIKKQQKLDHRLVLIGHPFIPSEWSTQAQMLFENHEVVWVGYLERTLMLRVLRGADLMVFPSYYEGFGRPVLEAMAAGVPVVCSRAASIPEVAGEAAVFFDPFSLADIAEKIVSVATNAVLRDELRKKGTENLKRFSWKKTAAETVAVYDEILREKKTRVGS